jgi:hypothetical protein
MLPMKNTEIETAKDKRTTMRTLHIRIRDKHAKFLRALAYDTNQVWNFCNALSIEVFERERRFMSGYDLQKYTDGASKEGINLHPQTIQAIALEYATRRSNSRKYGWPDARAAVHSAHSGGYPSRNRASLMPMARSAMAKSGCRCGIAMD